jgi:predicted ATPase/DNA-binding CsgD family transcriptional regulator
VTTSGTLDDAGVSAREAEVLDLLGEHLTNAEIGARLYISVRTVESHVSSLLRKLALADRRALAQFAAGVRAESSTGAGDGAPPAPEPTLPSPLTSFVGRTEELSALAAALDGQRLVTAVGPGGVGKTRLALAVAAALADRYSDGVWYVDLVPVTDPAMIPTAVAAALGLSDQPGRTLEQTVLARLAQSDALVILDNCEHLVDSVVLFVERLLAGCPRLTVLATSRARLLVPFERVFPVAGLSASGDAVDLFMERAAAVGSPPLGPDDRPRIAAICAKLDGMALAIELAAARLPTLGLDGLEAGLDDQLHVLAGRSRVDERHSSLRAALDWSYALLSPVEQAVLRRVAVFAAPFRPEDASAVVGFAPVAPHDVGHALGQLADQSLLVVTPDPAGTRYRALETIRQYGEAQLATDDEADDVHLQHLRCCMAMADELAAADPKATPVWRTAFDDSADDMRAALGWAADQSEHRADAHRLAVVLADLCYARGLTGECQRRYEQAADLADDDAAVIDALRRAAGAAQSRQVGEDALRLRQAAAEAARRSGDLGGAAIDLAAAATLVRRVLGIFATPPPEDAAATLLAESRVLAVASADIEAHAALLVAEAFDASGRDPLILLLAQRAAELSGRIGNPVLQSAALDALMAINLAIGDMAGAMAAGLRRLELLDPLPISALSGFELLDGCQMTAEVAIGSGDIPAARHYVERLLDMPTYSNEGHLATSRLLMVEGLAGDWERLLDASVRFRDGWERAGRPATSNLSVGAAAVAMVHGLRGDDEARDDWLAVVRALRTTIRHSGRSVPVFDAMVWLHRGQYDQALTTLATPPEDLHEWWSGRWRQWHAAVWAEAAVLARQPDAAERIERARFVTTGNRVTTAMVHRAAVLLADDPGDEQLVVLAGELEGLGCRYQAARTLAFAAGEPGEAGAATLAALGAMPMASR